MSKRDILQKIESLRRSVRDHNAKINNADPGDGNTIQWWQREIYNMEREIESLESELNQSADEVTCPGCGRTVIPRNNTCPKCDTYII